jgi:hypothetical protein
MRMPALLLLLLPSFGRLGVGVVITLLLFGRYPKLLPLGVADNSR